MLSVEELLRRQKALSDFARFVLEHEGDLQGILDESCRLIASALKAELAQVLEIEPQRRTALVRARVGLEEVLVGEERISLNEQSSEACAIAEGEAVVTGDNEMRFATVPIFLPGRQPWGLLQVGAREVRQFDDPGIDFLSTFAMLLGPVIDRLLKRKALRDREEQLQHSGETSDKVLRLQHALSAELQHRVRNILAMVRSLIRRSAQTKTDLGEFVQHVEGRIDAMARTQALLTRAPGRPIDLEDLIRDEMLAQSAAEGKFALRGPPAFLDPHAAEVLTLALHELATNSVKYGALGQAEGQVRVEWEIRAEGDQKRLHLVWHETGLRGHVSPEPGFGTELITKRVPYELKGQATMDFNGSALTAKIEFPLQQKASILETSPVPWRTG
jgi:two-component sensor histidine kinase